MSKPVVVFRSPAGEAKYKAAYEAELAAWPLPYEALDVPSRFGRTHIIASGPREAPPLVLLHGLCGDPIEWRENVPVLARTHRVYCVSALGDVGKSVATRVPATRPEAAFWLTEIFGELGIERARVAGHSYGGFLATLLAIYAPDRVEKIIPLAPAGFAPLSLELWARMLGFMITRAPAIRQSYLRWLYADSSPRNARIDEHISLSMEHGKPSLKVSGSFTDDELGKIRAPVLLLVGQYERCFDPVAAVDRARRLVPSIEAQIIPNTSHALPFEKPDIVNAAMLQFLG